MREQIFHYKINATSDVVYDALLDKKLLPFWKAPDDMSLEVHEFSPVEGGTFRISLTYNDLANTGKSSKSTDTYHGYFKTLIPHQKIVEVIEFETANPIFSGEMIVTTKLITKDLATEIEVVHENLPEAVSEEQNELGWRMSLGKLAKLIDGFR